MKKESIRKLKNEKGLKKSMDSNPEVSQSKHRSVSYGPVKEETVCCPKCGSSQLSANKKGLA